MPFKYIRVPYLSFTYSQQRLSSQYIVYITYTHTLKMQKSGGKKCSNDYCLSLVCNAIFVETQSRPRQYTVEHLTQSITFFHILPYVLSLSCAPNPPPNNR